MDGISLSTFLPIERLSPTELENAALSPFRFANRVDASITGGEDMEPLTTRVLVPELLPLTPTPEGMDIPFDCNSIFLIPGGRFMLADTTDHGLCLWDIGIHPGSPINPSLALLHKATGETTRFTSPTPNAYGVYICIAGEM